jgi:hypothetical protein
MSVYLARWVLLLVLASLAFDAVEWLPLKIAAGALVAWCALATLATLVRGTT